MAKILVVDDEPDAVELVEFNLKNAGFEVITAADGAEALKKARAALPDLVVLDLMIPEVDGLEVCKLLRRDAATAGIPILMLTAKAAEIDRVLGLELGADDYVTKPFSPRELLARIRAVLRRSRTARGNTETRRTEIITFDGWTMDLRRREVQSPSGTLIDLSTGEFDLLVAFAEHANRVLSREALMQFAKARTSGDPFDRTIDVQISRLRRKLEAVTNGGQLIKTVRGSGYMFASDVRVQEGQPA